jgi:hypothetical protein
LATITDARLASSDLMLVCTDGSFNHAYSPQKAVGAVITINLGAGDVIVMLPGTGSR